MAPRSAQQRQAPQPQGDDESLLVAAMANTESEIFTEAMGDEELELDGDTSLEEMDDPAGEETDPEGDEEGDDDDTLQAGEDDGTDDGEDNDQRGDDRRDQANDQGRGRQERQERPSYRLPPVDPRDQRIADLEGRLARVEAPRTEQRQEQQAPAELPDPVLDPAGFREGIAAQIRAENQASTRTAILESNFRATEAAYGRENRGDEFQLAASQLNELSQRARTDPHAAAAVRAIVNAPDPGHALMQWAEDNLDLENFRQEAADRRIQEAARLLGVDPADLEGLAPQQRQAERPRRQEARQDRTSPERQPRGEQRQQQPAQRGGRRLPSLNSAGGVGREGGNSRNLDPNGFDGSEDAIFTFATH